jgi:phosphatidylserine/phosphatidylglycerophosphate/cardiolipin synthase-like enzyme
MASDLTSIVINEVMYDPEENDYYNEWIELYNPTNQSINVSGWSITDNNQEDFLEGDYDHGNGTTTIPPHGYAIIADHGTTIYENFSISNNTIRLYVDDSSIGNGLGNNQDKLILKNATGEVMDDLEWGYNYNDIPGMPADDVDEGHSLARYQDVDNNDSSIDFYDGVVPTPGSENIFVSNANVTITLYPLYIPKLYNNSEYSIPFAIKVSISNYIPFESYQLKAYVVGNVSNQYPATQTWNGTSWIYSDRYTSTIITDENGNWTGWICLRFKKEYQEYLNNIQTNSSAYIKVKIKKDNSTDETAEKVYLLDMDDSTSNGVRGGTVLGQAYTNVTYLEDCIAIVKNNSGIVTGIYVTEDNNIEEGFTTTSGYYKISSPISSNNTITFLDEQDNIIHTISNVTIEQGRYNVDIDSAETSYFVKRYQSLNILVKIKNTGDFYDNITVEISQISNGWHGSLEKELISLMPGESYNINLHVTPCQSYHCLTGSITISILSEKDIGETDSITFYLEILGPDLIIKNIKLYDENDEECYSIMQGETLEIKAYLKNQGNENASDVNVSFYYNHVDKSHFIGCKKYSSVGKYQKYPSIKWDTTHILPGDYNIFAVADYENNVYELNEWNNELLTPIIIYDTRPTQNESTILITEFYYHTHPGMPNEYLAVFNPSNSSLDLSGWYITNQPWKSKSDQPKIIFPYNTTILPQMGLYLTQNASAYEWETGSKTDFEYNVDSKDSVPQMIKTKTVTFSNTGGVVALKNSYNHTIDGILYGEFQGNFSFWNDTSIPSSGAGVVLKRNFYQNQPVDTNRSIDWIHPRRYGIGQSDFPYVNISFTGEITTFVSPDCSFQTIVNELRNAKESIYFNIYEFTNPFLCDELVAALKRSVSVNIFVEGSPIGGIDDRERIILKKIANYGGKVRFIVNDDENRVHARYTFDHGKYLIIDNTSVIVGSCNWAKTGIPIDPSFGNREWGIIVRSKDVAEYFLNVFLDDWNPSRCDSYSINEMELLVPSDFYLDETIIRGSYKPQFEPITFNGSFSAIPVFSPDTSFDTICNLIDSASESIYIEQLYIYRDWSNKINPFVERLVNRSEQGVNIRVILNYNPDYETSNEKCNQTKLFFEEHGIEVKFVFTNWSYFTNLHNKGMIVDNTSVLISSINWNENSVTRNREAGIIIESEEVARYYTEVFFYDWNLIPTESENIIVSQEINRNTIYIAVIFTMTFALIIRDWRKRQWT